MNDTYTTDLHNATRPTLNTQWKDERPNIPPIKNAHITTVESWLRTIDSPTARSPIVWQAVKRNWIQFIAATSKFPTTTLAPNRKRIQLESGPETVASAKKRFRLDQDTRTSIQGALWRLFDSKEVLVERWPRGPRSMMNQLVNSDDKTPLSSVMHDFATQRRFNSVWSSLICFLVYCNSEAGAVQELGLAISEDLENALLDIEQAVVFTGFPPPGDNGDEMSKPIEDPIYDFVANAVSETNACPKTNPLFWWIVVLARSAIESGGEDDFISRGHFSVNILPMDLDFEQRLEGVIHFAKVFLLDMAFTTWPFKDEAQLVEVQDALNKVDNTWVGQYSSERPRGRPDERTCLTPAWRSVIAHIEKAFLKVFGKDAGTVIFHVIALQRKLVEEN